MGRILKDTTTPNERNLKAIANYFGVTEEWLLGKEENLVNEKTGEYKNEQSLIDRLTARIEDQGVKIGYQKKKR